VSSERGRSSGSAYDARVGHGYAVGVSVPDVTAVGADIGVSASDGVSVGRWVSIGVGSAVVVAVAGVVASGVAVTTGVSNSGALSAGSDAGRSMEAS